MSNSDHLQVRYVLHPGHVISANDGQMHFIGGHRLARLYGLDIRSQIVELGDRRRRRDLPGDVHLYPRFDGNYRLPASDCRAGVAEQGEAAQAG
jgi:hypothetical protein